MGSAHMGCKTIYAAIPGNTVDPASSLSAHHPNPTLFQLHSWMGTRRELYVSSVPRLSRYEGGTHYYRIVEHLKNLQLNWASRSWMIRGNKYHDAKETNNMPPRQWTHLIGEDNYSVESFSAEVEK